MRRRAIILVLDGVGVGAAPDAAAYGDAGSDTLGNVGARRRRARAARTSRRSGSATSRRSRACAPRRRPHGRVGQHASRVGREGQHDRALGDRRACTSRGRFRRIPNGFPADVIDAFARAHGTRRCIGNVRGERHRRSSTRLRRRARGARARGSCTRRPTPSSRSRRTRRSCRSTSSTRRARPRARMLVAPHDVSRVIARPFVGAPGAYARTANRRDYSLAPPDETLLDALAARRRAARRGGQGGRPVRRPRASRRRHTASNAEGIAAILEWLGGRAGWVAVRQPSRFRPAVRAPERRGGVRARAARVRRRSADASAPRFARTICCSSPPTTATIRRPRRRITPASACRCSRSASRSIRCRSGVRATFSDLGATVAEWLERRVPRAGDVVPPAAGARTLSGDAVGARGPSPEDVAGCFVTRRSPRWSRRTRRIPASASARRCSTRTECIVEGCNVENAAYPAGICAERVAVGAAVARGLTGVRGPRDRDRGGVPTPPCGMCRQVLVEFAPALPVLSVTRGGAEARWDMSELVAARLHPHVAGAPHDGAGA